MTVPAPRTLFWKARMKLLALFSLVFTMAALATTPAGAQNIPSDPPAAAGEPASDPPSGTKADSVLTLPNRFQHGDAIDLQVIGFEEELNGVYRIDQQGSLEIPYIGRIQAAGLTLPQLTVRLQTIVGRYYINDPHIVVQPLYNVTILGKVRQPGEYEIGGGETLSTLLAMAGGSQDGAKISRSTITRDGVSFQRNLDAALTRGETVNDIGIHSGDVIYIPNQHWYEDWRFWVASITALSLTIAIYDRVAN